MFTKEEVFRQAAAYDFDAVKEYLEQGGNPNIYDGSGSSLLTAILAAYYKHVFYSDPEEVTFLKAHDDDDEYHRHVNKYCKMPLEERPHAIKEQVEYMISKGISVNAVGWKEAEEDQKYNVGVDTPLYHSVMNIDYCMTKYLLEHGADPAQKLSNEENYKDIDYEDWLLEHMDIQILNGDSGEARDLELEITALLMHYGLDQWEGGVCIDVDKVNRTIRGHDPILNY